MENIENKNTLEEINHDNIRKIIGANLCELRKTNKLTQSELAIKFNYSDKAISKWERGEAIPDVITLLELAKFYGVKLEYILSDGNSKEKNKLKENKNRNRLIITLLSALGPWLIACLVYLITSQVLNNNYWLAFLWAIPSCLIVLIVFNALWGKKIIKFILISLLTWSLITCIYLQFLIFNNNIWLFFTIGIPLQIGIILWGLLEKNNL